MIPKSGLGRCFLMALARDFASSFRGTVHISILTTLP
jgi:hypothetical protein